MVEEGGKEPGEEKEQELQPLNEKKTSVERGHWEHSLDFLVSCLGYAVGLGNVWRFPFLCFQHGGGTFLIPYFFMLFFAGLPVFFLEVSIGQYAGVGPIKIFGRMAPLAGGLGLAVVGVSLFLAFFYNVVVSWSMWYLMATFAGMEWENCGHWYNTQNCWSKKESILCEEEGKILNEGSCMELSSVCRDHNMELYSSKYCSNSTYQVGVEKLLNKSSAVEEYFERYVLGNINADWTNFGYPRWESVLALGSAWALVAICLIKGVKSSGKVVYFTSLFPYLVLVLLAGRGFTLPGAFNGIKLFLMPVWSNLTDLTIWTDAATQVIFSLGPACGCVITLSSYNSFTRDCHKDSILIALCNSVTSLFSGLVVFSILGFMAHEAGVEVKDVIKSGPGLAFIVYPEVVTMMFGSYVWSALFFLMLISLALGSIFGAFETVLTALSDHCPALRTYKPITVVVTATIMFILGLPFTCNGGIHMFNLFNSAAPSWNLLLFALLEVLLVSWLYGIDNFMENLYEMNIRMPNWVRLYWRFTLLYTTPIILSILLLVSWINSGHIGYNGKDYPFGIQALGYLVTGSTVICLPLVAVYKLKDKYQESTAILGNLVKPTSQWGPNRDGSSVENLVP